MTTTWYVDLGAVGEVIPGTRRGLPDHIDGVPVRPTVPVLTRPRLRSLMGEPLPMIELREDGDAGETAASWPEPFHAHDLGRWV